MSGDCKYLSTVATFKIGTETFYSSGKTPLDPGYTAVMHWQALSKTETVPSFVTGELVNVHDVS